jgi:hypothetical protein
VRVATLLSPGLCESSVRRILHKDLHFYLYKIQVTHALHERDYKHRVNFCQTFFFLQLINQNQELVNNLLIFIYPDLLTNKISVIGLPQPPYSFMRDHFTVPKSQYGARYFHLELSVLTVLKMREKGLTVTGPSYIHMLDNFVGPELARHSVTEETFFQQDGATSHTTRDSMATVRNLFPNHGISKYGDITWPARSPDLSACDFFL